jgi:hypothetical protein
MKELIQYFRITFSSGETALSNTTKKFKCTNFQLILIITYSKKIEISFLFLTFISKMHFLNFIRFADKVYT